MESKTQTFAQLFLRIALSVSFLSAVADRLGYWGAPGSPFVSWGNWGNFVTYSNSVNSFVPSQLGEGLALFATVLEVLLPLFLLFGYKIKIASFATGVLLLSFGLAMTLSFSVKAPLDYSVFTGAGAAFLLGTIGHYKYSIDHLLSKEK